MSTAGKRFVVAGYERGRRSPDGNRRYVSVGNPLADDRVSLFPMDDAKRRGMKLFGRARIVGLDDEEMLSRLEMPDYRAHVERGFLIAVQGFDWKCPQHITERFTADEASPSVPPAGFTPRPASS